MSLVAGFDVGSLTTKAVLIENNKISGSVLIKSGPKPVVSAESVLKKLLDETGTSETDIKRSVGTGYGREKIGFIDEAVSEISCHGKGARFFIPSVRTIIDIGGQDCKVIKLDDKGNLEKFITNDKCASGTGRFLDVMATVMNIQVSELGTLSEKSSDPVTFPSICTVWAQADVIKHINSRRPAEDICAGINTAMANRVSMLTNAVKVKNDICMTGGVAKNKGVVTSLGKLLGCRIKKIRREDPQLMGAIGAALFAQEKV